ncbi:MAG: alpha/beta hydrolase, partial [Candidatus Ratteibacteria bacterium]
MDDIVWECSKDVIRISPASGGRIISWKHKGKELVNMPVRINGGILRVLFGDERYPGSSYAVPHIVKHQDKWSVSMRYFWNTPDEFARIFDWQGKANLLYVDGLLLDKTISFIPELSVITVELMITNLSGKRKVLVPWLHNCFSGIFHDAFMVIDGRKTPYVWMDVFWDGHRVGHAKSAKLVGVSRDNDIFVTLAADVNHLKGMAAYTEKTNGPEYSNEASLEVRFSSINIEPGFCLRSKMFVAVSENEETWMKDNPVIPLTGLEKSQVTYNKEELITLLPLWALKEEKEKGLMVISYLDKLPFSSEKRYSANHSFFHFTKHGTQICSHVILVPLRDMNVFCKVSGNSDWSISMFDKKPVRNFSAFLEARKIYKLTLYGQASMLNRNDVRIDIACPQETVVLEIEKEARVEKEYPYAVKQVSFYCDERWRRENSLFSGSTAEQFSKWQQKLRKRHLEWLRKNVIYPCKISARIIERQIGYVCIRDKVVVQSEPGMWIPAYVIYPKKHKGKMPSVIFFHGSGPGKQMFVSDEGNSTVLEPFHELENIAYRLAGEKGYLVYCPDQRGWGEWGESSYAQQPQRAEKAGYDMLAMMIHDHIRSIDYLFQREDVDTSRIGCFGSSGGGLATMYVAGIDERVKAAIISSSSVFMPYASEDFFFKFKDFEQ